MYKASPRVFITEWAKTAVSATEVVANDNDFISLGTSYARMEAGYATATNAPMPDWVLYDRGRVVFTIPTLGNADNNSILELLASDADGNIYSLGRSTLANGTFPPIEFDVTYEKYHLRVLTITGTTQAVTVGAAVQGFYRSGLATT